MIPTLNEPERIQYLSRLKGILDPQIARNYEQVELRINDAPRSMTTGQKRNELIKSAKGEYTVFIDDDDHISETYVEDILNASRSNADVIGIQGWMTTNGQSRVNFEIRKGYPYIEVTRECLGKFPFLAHRLGWYVRFPNILAPMKREISSAVNFPHITKGEDYVWALEINNRKLIKSEAFIEKMLYHYDFKVDVPISVRRK